MRAKNRYNKKKVENLLGWLYGTIKGLRWRLFRDIAECLIGFCSVIYCVILHLGYR